MRLALHHAVLPREGQTGRGAHGGRESRVVVAVAAGGDDEEDLAMAREIQKRLQVNETRPGYGVLLSELP